MAKVLKDLRHWPKNVKYSNVFITNDQQNIFQNLTMLVKWQDQGNLNSPNSLLGVTNFDIGSDSCLCA